MKFAHRPSLNTSLSFERLEDRWALAGEVLVEAKGSDLKITGDSFENDIAITVFIAQDGPKWRITGNNTLVKLGKDGVPAASVDVDVPDGFFRKVTADMKFADPDGNTDKKHKSGNEKADTVSMTNLIMTGDLKIAGGNAGVVNIAGSTVRGKTTIDFDKLNGLSTQTLGCQITITDSTLGVPAPNGNAKAIKDVIITTKDCADVVAMANVDVGKSLTIKTAGAADSVALIQDVNVGKNVAIDAGSKEKVAAADLVVGSDVSVGGKTTVKTGLGADILAIGAIPDQGANTLTGDVLIDTGAGDDIDLIQGTTFKKKATVLTKAGNDRVGVAQCFVEGGLEALKKSNGGDDFDILLNDLGLVIGPGDEPFQGFESTGVIPDDLEDLAEDVVIAVAGRLGAFLASRGIVLPPINV